MKLYLSSYCVPTPEDLFNLVSKPAADMLVAIIPNTKDAYIERIWSMRTKDVTDFFASIGVSHVDIIDLRNYSSALDLGYSKL